MKLDTALILCAGLGKRLHPLTLTTPKPLLKFRNKTMLESCINTTLKLGIKNIIINTFHLSDQINEFIKKKNFSSNIKIINDGKEILNTGGGILNMINHSNNKDFLIFNPDTYWNEESVNEIKKMQSFYFASHLDNILMVVKKKLSFDPKLKGDFKLNKNILTKNSKKDYIFIGCQILNKNLFENYIVKNFSISEIWNILLKEKKLNGFESFNEFYHLTNLEIFNKLKDF